MPHLPFLPMMPRLPVPMLPMFHPPELPEEINEVWLCTVVAMTDMKASFLTEQWHMTNLSVRHIHV
jgi:hypothetical protein